MGFPKLQHRPPHYSGNRLHPFRFVLKRNGNTMDLTGGTAKCMLKDKKTKEIKFTFPSNGENSLVVDSSGVAFPDIRSWSPPPGVWDFDVRLELPDEVIYFTVGDWPIIQHITDGNG